MSKIDKAYKKLKNYVDSCDEYECFKSLFFDRVDENNILEAIELLLQVIYKSLKSDGERFNIFVESLEQKNKQKVISWLNDQIKKRGI